MDSIGSAIGYAELKSRLDPGTEYVPVRLGELNPQTRWVLEHAGVEEPELLQHIYVRARDLMHDKFGSVDQDDALRHAGIAIDGDEYDLVPVTSRDGRLVGVITTRALARRYVRETPGSGSDTLAAACRELMEDAEVVVSPDDTVSDVAEQLKNTRQGAAIIVNDDDHPIGLLRRSHMVSPMRRKVILVDHAEQAQAVPGIEQADIVEILDHHHIGSIETHVRSRRPLTR